MMSNPKVETPTRVIYNYEGDATTFERAQALYGITPDIVFMRNDGWSLGAPYHLEGTAYYIWRDQWKWFATKGDTHFRPISEYA